MLPIYMYPQSSSPKPSHPLAARAIKAAQTGGAADSSEMEDQPSILRPIPRRAWDLINPTTTTSCCSSEVSTAAPPSTESGSSSGPKTTTTTTTTTTTKATPPSRTPSVLNLTSSTLFGIYAPASYGGDIKDEQSATPWGVGTQTPIHGRQTSLPETLLFEAQRPRLQRAASSAAAATRHGAAGAGAGGAGGAPRRNLLLRTMLLFLFGVAYGVIITHLHDEQHLAPVQIDSLNRYDWPYLVFWGFAGVGLGSLLPWIDRRWETQPRNKHQQHQRRPGSAAAEPGKQTARRKVSARINGDDDDDDDDDHQHVELDSSFAAPLTGPLFNGDWNPVVRSIGAFVGIAFAIRKLPWQSTLQVSLTLALVNPVLWYIIDRSKPGFFLSALVGVTGTALLFSINPDIVPVPAHAHASTATLSPPPLAASPSANNNQTGGTSGAAWHGVGLVDSIGVGTWIASVLFCSCVCFGNIGRRLALRTSA
ncbi:MAG: hypothetical protein M1816_006730 [Peltula sp. TS41687]|nr:MAG: hypothetical protein M1816_006730 [Peltula sp. TS41687]